MNKDRFWVKVNKVENGCWLWTASGGRYGLFWVPEVGKLQMAHRVAYELLVEKIPEELELDHLCGNPLCVNPDHLEPVTHQENVLRGKSFSAVNAVKVRCVRGHAFTSENTRLDARGHRVCRECRRIHNRAYKTRRKLRA